MATETHPYLFLSVFLAASVFFGLVPLGLARWWAKKFSPAKPGEQKNATYECGLESKGSTVIQFKSEYYLYAILFLIFDVENQKQDGVEVILRLELDDRAPLGFQAAFVSRVLLLARFGRREFLRPPARQAERHQAEKHARGQEHR